MDRVWVLGSEQKRPMCGLVANLWDNIRNPEHAIDLKRFACRKRHTSVVVNARYEISLIGTWLDRAVRIAEVDGGGAVDRDRRCLGLKKGFSSDRESSPPNRA
jgi:hypothetical protein